MPKTIVQKVRFKNTTPKTLYDLYMNAKQHSLVTGAPAAISAKAGSRYTAHGGYIEGKNLHVIPNRMIVQTWRSDDWKADEDDSIFTLLFEPAGKDVVLHVTHAFVPDREASGIDQGWYTYYWDNWKKHLAGKPVKKPAM